MGSVSSVNQLSANELNDSARQGRAFHNKERRSWLSRGGRGSRAEEAGPLPGKRGGAGTARKRLSPWRRGRERKRSGESERARALWSLTRPER